MDTVSVETKKQEQLIYVTEYDLILSSFISSPACYLTHSRLSLKSKRDRHLLQFSFGLSVSSHECSPVSQWQLRCMARIAVWWFVLKEFVLILLGVTNLTRFCFVNSFADINLLKLSIFMKLLFLYYCMNIILYCLSSFTLIFYWF